MKIIRAGGVPYPGYIEECVFKANFAYDIPITCKGQSYGQSGLSIFILQRILSSFYTFEIVKLDQKQNQTTFEALDDAFNNGTADMGLDIWRGTFIRSLTVDFSFPVLFSQTVILTSASSFNPRQVTFL